MGALHAMNDFLLEFGGSIEVHPEDIVRVALEAAEKYSGGVCKPFNILKLKK